MSTDFLITTGVIAGILIGSQYLRASLAQALPPGSLALGLLLEAIATFELCAVAFEQGLYFEYYGLLVFHVALFFICLWRFYNWRDVRTAPYTQLERWMEGELSLGQFLLYVAAELTAGALVYQYFMKPIWSLGLSTHHTTKLNNFVAHPCRTAVNVHYAVGALIEGGCTFAIEISFYFLGRLRGVSPHLLNAARSAIITVMVYAAFFTTGGFMSPVLASVVQYNCGGITALRHVIVYWAGPTLGSLFCVFLVKRLNPPGAGAGAGAPPSSSSANGAAESRKDS